MKFGKFLKALGQLLEPEKKPPYPTGTFFMVTATKRGQMLPNVLSYGWDFRHVFNYKLWPADGYDDSVTLIITTFNPRNTIMKELPVQAERDIDWHQILHGLPGIVMNQKDLEGFVLQGDGLAPDKGSEI